mmetsp:Transcript_27171/g.74922  ORF Transcript_27171/g.74922 Transcript_27171/m.74922 type:complete len:210 (+) Transcript_27171:186-815(+)
MLLIESHFQSATLKLAAIKAFNRSFRVLLAEELHRTKAFRLSSRASRDFCTANISSLTKVIFELFPSSLKGQVPNIQLRSFGARWASSSSTRLESTATTSSPAASTTVSAARSASPSFTILAGKHGSTLQFRVLQFSNGPSSLLRALIHDNTTTNGLSMRVGEDCSRVNVSGTAHMVFQILPANLRSKVPHIDRSILTPSAGSGVSALI